MITILAFIFIILFGNEPDTPKVKTKEVRHYYVEKGKKDLTAITKEEYSRNGDLEYSSVLKTSNNRLTEVFYHNSYDSLQRKVAVRLFTVESKDTVWRASKIIEYHPNQIVEKTYDRNGTLLSRNEKLFADSTALLIANISFSLVPVEPWNTEWMECKKYYYNSSKKLKRVSKVLTSGVDLRELEYEYKDEATTICRQYNNSGRLEMITTTVKTPRQKLELTEIYSDIDTTKSGTRTTYNSRGLIESSHNYPDYNQGFYEEYYHTYYK